MSAEAATMALKSRAEVQLLSVLNQKKARSASFYLKGEQQKALAEDEEESQQTQARNRVAFEALPPCSEEARMIAEVRQLEDDFFIVGAESVHKSPSEGPSQIELNGVRRRDRHMEAQMQYVEEVKAISEDVEAAIIRAADHVKEVLATIDAGIQEAKVALTNDQLLLASDNETILGMWGELEAVCQRRTDELAHFAAQLEDIEQTRIDRVRVGLQQLTCALMETAHALPPEVERIIEAEAYEVNTVVICNRRVYADLVARMGTVNVDVFLNARLAWEQGQIQWRHLRHDDAVARFKATLDSPLFTDPDERQHVLQQIRTFQEKVHSEQRLAVLQQLNDAGAFLSSDQAKRILEELSATQQFEEEKNQSFFSDLRVLHESKAGAAKTLRENLRLELHGFGAMAKEGAIEEARRTLGTLLSDDSMEDFFRAAGGLKTELDTFVKQLYVAELIYSANLEPVVTSVGVLLSALPLESVMEKQGKEAERKAVQSTLEKIRKATKGEIMSLLPSLQTQISMLMNLDEMNDSFKRELGEIMTQLDTIIQEYDTLQASDTGSTSPVNSSAGAPIEKTASRSPPVAAPVSSPKSTKKSSAMFGAASTSKNKASEAPQSCGNVVDLQAIRKVQRRLGTLVYASELGATWQQHLQFIADQLLLQTNANHIVDEVIARECDNLIETRREESRLLVEEMGKRMEQQSVLLHDQVEKLAKFFLRVVLCMEESVDKVQYVNLSVLDLLDTLKEHDEETLADSETKFKHSCARLRHAPNDAVLRNEFQRSSDLLMLIEGEYREYDKRVALAADNNVVAIAKQRLLYLQRLSDLFGLRQLNRPKSDDSFNLDYFLSAQHIEQVLNPTSSETADAGTATAAEYQAAFDEPELSASQEEMFRTASGLELVVVLSLATIAHNILAQSEDEDGDQESPREEGATVTSHSEEKEPHGGGPSQRADGDGTTDVEPDSSRLRHQAVLGKVQTEFLVLDLPSDTVDGLLAAFRDAILSKYDSDATTTSTQTEGTRDERHESSSMLLEERLRVHWPRKGRLDVQFYQPRMGELLNHQQRQERHLRGVWLKADEQQAAFRKKVEDALAHVEQTRMTQISFQAQLPLQLSLAALQGLEVKAKKRLGVFRGEAMETLVTLRATTESDINSLLSSCQDYIRACSSQLFPDLTSCEIISGCDYHPEEIAAIKEKLVAIEAQARDQISEREKQMVEISNEQSQILDTSEAFKARYQACMQSLSMKEGLGQKFGLPRRTAQERYRSEMTRCESRSAAINTLLASLESLVKEGKIDGYSESSLPEKELTCHVLRMLMQLRAKIYHRGMYFGFLRSPSQLEPKPVEFNPAAGQQEEGAQEVIRDLEVVDEEDQTLAVPFLEFADQVSAKCQEETKALYQQEGKIEELPPSGVPAALEEYLSSQVDKAQVFVLQQEGTYREQVSLFAHLLTLVPGVVVMNFMEKAKRQMQRQISGVASVFDSDYQSWMSLKNQHTLELRPHLCSPNNAHLLQELEERERTRSTLTQVALHNLRSQFLAGQMHLSLTFEARVIGLCQCLLLLLDSSVLSLDDLKPFSGEELPKLQRKSLKRLRKVARVNEFGDPREVKRTAAELQKLTQCSETPRFPLRSWSGIPSFGLQSFWEEVIAEILAKDSAGSKPSSASASIIKADSTIHDLVCVPLAANDGACVTLLTPAHRALVRARDSVYVDYVKFCGEETRRFLETLHERLEDEVKWTLSWEKGIERMKQQQQQ
ncbi:DNA-directed RNA polymerase III subunit RPC8 [Phytophthora pseudosyringae]|uniref:DNA-directed RNA polymerase III subunit RPC8 n=1 Tax=Phytophthora pseudosyringae TaxID=221518 RepID=A0A8T1VYT2_9STRA|nr:DNA-directed RNA polymerase III subunit RPC8 [Phytophthora pseudosyringae]